MFHSLCFFCTHFLFDCYLTRDHSCTHCEVLPVICLTERCFPVYPACLLCMILPGPLFIDFLDYPLCFGCLIGLMFLLGPIACLLTLAFWNSPLYVERSDCYLGFDPLPASSYLSVETFFNKLLHMDSHSASASSLQNTSPPLNPAEVSNLQAAFAYQSNMLKEYQEQLTKLQSVNEHLTHYITSTTHAKDGKLCPS